MCVCVCVCVSFLLKTLQIIIIIIIIIIIQINFYISFWRVHEFVNSDYSKFFDDFFVLFDDSIFVSNILLLTAVHFLCVGYERFVRVRIYSELNVTQIQYGGQNSDDYRMAALGA